MRLRWKNSICLVYKLWIAFTVITFDFVKSLRNHNRSSYEFILGTSSAKEILYTTKSPLKSSRTSHLTALLALPKHLTYSQNSTSEIRFEVNKAGKIEQNETFPIQNLEGLGFNYLNEKSLSISNKMVLNSSWNTSYSKRNSEKTVDTRAKRHLEKIDVEQQVCATCDVLAHLTLIAHKQKSTLMDEKEENPKTLTNQKESILQLNGTIQPENTYAPTNKTSFTALSSFHLLHTNLTMGKLNPSDVREDRSESKETNIKVNNYHPTATKRKERLLDSNEEEQNSNIIFDKHTSSSVNLQHSNKTLVVQNKRRVQASIHDDGNRHDENCTQFTSHDILRKAKKANPVSQNFHIVKPRHHHSKRSSISEEHVSEDVITDVFETFTTALVEEAEIESQVTESQFLESVNNKISESKSEMDFDKSFTKQSSFSKELISVPFAIMDNMTPSYESSELVSYAIINSNSTPENLEMQTTSGEQDDLIERFKLKYPVKLWKSLGLLEDTYLKNINVHWMKFEPPSPIVHKIFAAFYGVFMVVGCGANFIVIFMFSR